MTPRRKAPLTPEQRYHLKLALYIALLGIYLSRLASGDVTAVFGIAEILIDLCL